MAMAGWHLGGSHGKAGGQLGSGPDVQLSRSLSARHRGENRGGSRLGIRSGCRRPMWKYGTSMAYIGQEWDGFGVNELSKPYMDIDKGEPVASGSWVP